MHFKCIINTMKKFLKAILFIIILISISIIINMYLNKSNVNNKNKPTGLGLFISNKNNSIHNQVIDYTHIDDYTYNLNNQTGKDLDCNLNVFMNGKKVKLLNNENGTIDYNIKFSINNDENKKIPISLKLDDIPKGSYIVNFNIVTDYDKYAIDNPEKVWQSSTYNYTVAITNNDNTLSIPSVDNIKSNQISIENVEYSQFIANYSEDEFKANSSCKNYIEANTGSIIEIPFILGGCDTTEMLVYGTLNNNQILLNNSDILVYNLVKNTAIVDNIKIQVPDKSGKYELLFYSFNNFRNVDINDFGGINFSKSHRITLIAK